MAAGRLRSRASGTTSTRWFATELRPFFPHSSGLRMLAESDVLPNNGVVNLDSSGSQLVVVRTMRGPASFMIAVLGDPWEAVQQLLESRDSRPWLTVEVIHTISTRRRTQPSRNSNR